MASNNDEMDAHLEHYRQLVEFIVQPNESFAKQNNLFSWEEHLNAVKVAYRGCRYKSKRDFISDKFDGILDREALYSRFSIMCGHKPLEIDNENSHQIVLNSLIESLLELKARCLLAETYPEGKRLVDLLTIPEIPLEDAMDDPLLYIYIMKYFRVYMQENLMMAFIGAMAHLEKFGGSKKQLCIFKESDALFLEKDAHAFHQVYGDFIGKLKESLYMSKFRGRQEKLIAHLKMIQKDHLEKTDIPGYKKINIGWLGFGEIPSQQLLEQSSKYGVLLGLPDTHAQYQLNQDQQKWIEGSGSQNNQPEDTSEDTPHIHSSKKKRNCSQGFLIASRLSCIFHNSMDFVKWIWLKFWKIFFSQKKSHYLKQENDNKKNGENIPKNMSIREPLMES